MHGDPPNGAGAAPQLDRQVRALLATGASAGWEWESNRTPELLDRAIAAFREAVDQLSVNSPLRSHCWAGLAQGLTKLYQSTGDGAALDEAIEAWRSALHSSEKGGSDAANWRRALGYGLLQRLSRSDRADDLDELIAIAQQSAEATSSTEGEYATLLSSLAKLYLWRFERTNQEKDLDAAIGVLRQTVAAQSHLDAPRRQEALFQLANALDARFATLDTPAALTELIEAWRRALETADASALGDLGPAFARLAVRYRIRFRGEHSLDDLSEAIHYWRRAIVSGPPGQDDIVAWHADLGNALRNRYECTGEVSDLDDAVDAIKVALRGSDALDNRRAHILADFAATLNLRFQARGSDGDLELAVLSARAAVGEVRGEDSDRPYRLTVLAGALHERFRVNDQVSDLDEAVGLVRTALLETPGQDEERTGRTSNLSALLRVRAHRTGRADDLRESVGLARAALRDTQVGSPDRAARLSNLCAALRLRSALDDRIENLNEAVAFGREAITLAGRDDPARGGYLSNLGHALSDRFGRFNRLEDLDEAISVTRRAAAETPETYRTFPGHLSDLANLVARRSEWTGLISDLDEAIRVCRLAALHVQGGTAEARAINMSTLGALLYRRFQRTREMDDLDASIRAGSRAAAVNRSAHHLSNLAVALRERFEAEHELEDLSAAIEAAREAVDVARPSEDLAGMLANLAGSLYVRFTHSQRACDLEEAVGIARRATSAASSSYDAHERSTRNHTSSLLGVLLAECFKSGGDRVLLEEAVDLGRQAVARTPRDSAERVLYLSQLVESLHLRFQTSGRASDVEEAIAYCREASQAEFGAATLRFSAARKWGAMAADVGRDDLSLEGYVAAVALLPAVTWHGLDRAAREDLVADCAGLGSDAAAIAVRSGDLELAVELLEQSRSLLWNQAIGLRADLGALRAKAPGLADLLDHARAVLDSPIPAPSASGRENGLDDPDRPVNSDPRGLEARRHHARVWDETISQIQSLGGDFERFLEPVSYRDLAARIGDGPVIVLNASRYGCHALIIRPERDVVLVELSCLTLDAAVQVGLDLARALERRPRDRSAALGVLSFLWSSVAKPVMRALGISALPGGQGTLPHVWWCPVGPLSGLPVHAAGEYSRGRNAELPSSLLDLVVSSYAPSLGALARARARTSPEVESTLAVGMPITDGLPPLPAARSEVDVVTSHVPRGSCSRQLIGAAATRGAVLTEMLSSSWVHFACHARQRQDRPSASAFALADGDLEVADLILQPTRDRELAFLSACETVRGSIRHSDEAIHLAGVMQFLGFKHVVGTLWTISDQAAPLVAKAFYSGLIDDGSRDVDRAARALHDAVQSLREQAASNPLLWAPYAHIGP